MVQYYTPYQQQSYQPYQDRLAQLQNQYQQAMPGNMQPMMQPPVQQQITQGFQWVQGESGAKAWMVAPGATVLLMDSEGSRFYLKSSDNAGMPSLRTFEFKEVLPNAPQASQAAFNVPDDKYVTREEYVLLQGQFAELLNKINSLIGGSTNEQ